MKKTMWIVILIAGSLLTACGGSESSIDTVPTPVSVEQVDSEAEQADSGAAEGAGQAQLAEPEVVVVETAPAQTDDAGQAPAAAATEPGAISMLTSAYGDALSLEAQLALGTMELEQTALAVDEAQAAALLPLWQAFDALTRSGAAAQVELDAVAAQIAQTMTAAQVAAIGELQLTNQIMAERIAEGGLNVGRGLGAAGATGAGAGSGIPGSGAGGGMGRGLGGGQPGTGATVDPEAQATRQAERESGAFQEQALTFAVIRLLQTKSGEMAQSGVIADTVITVLAAETGLEAASIQEQLAAGMTATEIIQNAGGDVDNARAALLAALSALDNAAELDMQAIVDRWLAP